MTKHNKKRNIGIMYELLLRHISSKLIEGDKKSAQVATRIIETRFAKNTELYKEFRLFNALVNTSVKNTEIAAAILSEAKQAAKRFNSEKLEKEKSSLIRDINYKISDKSFYYRSVPDYRQYANIHNMIKEWQKGDMSDLKKTVMLEQKSLSHLMCDKQKASLEKVNEDIDSSSSNLLIEKIMAEKINNKYSNFSPSQREIIQKYALYGSDSNSHEALKEYLLDKKKESLRVLSEFAKTNDNNYISEKINLVESKITNLDVTELTDDVVTKFLTLTSLVQEIKTGE